MSSDSKGDPKTADELFLGVLSRMVLDPDVLPNDLLVVGNYLFTGGAIVNTAQTANRIFLTPIKVGTVSLTADISVDRDGLSVATVKTYLTEASEILARPIANEQEQSRAWATAYLLMRKAQVYAPELVSRFAALASRARGAQVFLG